MEILRVAGVGVAAALLALVVRQERPELAVIVSLAGGALLLLIASERLASLRETVGALAEQSGVGSATLAYLLRVLALSAITEIASQTCRDAGEAGLAVKVELCGRLILLSLAAPLLLSLTRALTDIAP